MGAAIRLRDDFDTAGLIRPARATRSANQGRRLLALAEIYDGGRHSDAARIAGVTSQIVRDWVVRFNDRGPYGLLDRKVQPMCCQKYRSRFVPSLTALSCDRISSCRVSQRCAEGRKAVLANAIVEVIVPVLNAAIYRISAILRGRIIDLLDSVRA